MTAQLLDYHVGLMRGYLLANNAPTQILNALDVLLGGYQSKAGEVIGKIENIPATKLAAAIINVQKTAPKHDDAPTIAPAKDNAEKKKYFWNRADDEILKKMYVEDGAKPKAISKILDRTPASISTRISNLGLKKKGSVA
jgi:hypothetical protein